MNRTYMAKDGEVERKWWVVDASGVPLGRLASRVAHVLRGKHKPTFTPHVDMGDHVVVINADKVTLSGRKPQQKMYYRHSRYPGGLKSKSYEELMEEEPELVVKRSILGMLPKNKLGRKMGKKLKVYPGSDHPHEAQKPEDMDIEL